MIEVRKLSKHYHNLVAVDALSFAVQPGEVLGFLGPNGAGKTTTMRMLAGFITPTAGDALVFGYSVCDQPLEVKRLIGYLPEGAPLYDEMTPLQFLRFIAGIRGIQQSKQATAIDAVINTLGLTDVLHQPIDTLSKGYRRRVGLAQAIIHDPQVLILDEPTDGLDPNQKHEVRELIHNLANDKIIIVSTHILEEVEAVCSRAIIIAKGHICADDTPAALCRLSPQHNAVTLCFTAAIPPEQLLSIADTLTNSGIAKEIRTNPDDFTITALAANGRHIIQDINALAQQHHWQPEQVRLETGKLNDVFRSVTAP